MKCHWYRFWINRSVDDNQPLSPAANEHVHTCLGCRHFYQAQREVVIGFSRIDELKELPSQFLKDRILSQVRADSRKSQALSFGPQWAGASSVIAVALAFAVLFLGSRGNRVEIDDVSSGTPRRWVAVTAKAASGEQLFRVATNLNQPLYQELDLVIRDAQKVIGSLKEEFVPPILLTSTE